MGLNTETHTRTGCPTLVQVITDLGNNTSLLAHGAALHGGEN